MDTSALGRTSSLNKNRVIELAIEAGFEPYESTSLSGKSELDQTLQVGEYPIGESVFKLVRLVERELKRDRKQLKVDLGYARIGLGTR